MAKNKTIPVLCEAVTTYVPAVNPTTLPQILNSQDVADLVVESWEDIWHRETFKVLLLNHQNRVLGIRTIGVGGISMCPVDIKLILQSAITGNATSVILIHNHPTGSVQGSEADDILTRRIVAACNAVDIKMLDHVIIAGDGTRFSYADEGKL